MSANHVDAIVVGAGLSGLVAAQQIVSAGRSALVLEARDRVGGRMHSHVFAGGEVIDLGAQWIAPTQPRMRGLIESLGIDTHPTYDSGLNVLLSRGRRVEYQGAIPFLGPLVMLDIFQAQTRFELKARRVPIDAPWRVRNAAWDRETFESWIRRTAFTRRGRDFFRLFSSSILAVDAGECSLLHALFYAHSSRSLDHLIRVEGGNQQDQIVGGTQAICERLHAKIGLDVVRHHRAVRRIECGSDRVRVTARRVDGEGEESFCAQRVIVTLPPTLAQRIEYAPALPADRDHLTQRVPAGSVTKCIAVYERPFWRAEGFSGQAVAVEGAVAATFDATPPDSARGVLVAFLFGSQARTLGRLPCEERRSRVLRELTEIFGSRAEEPVEYQEKDWAEDEWTRGAYGAHFAPGAWTGYGRALKAPAGRIHWAGAETGTHYSGQMEGAAESGERAALELLGALD